MTRVLILTLVTPFFLVACGDGGPGAPVSFTPPNRSGTTPFAGTGGDRSNGTDRGGGTTPAFGTSTESDTTENTPAPAACSQTKPCSSGQCSSGSTRGGYCIEQCNTESCSEGYQCVQVQSKSSFCLIPCRTVADCPAIPGLSGACVTVAAGKPAVCNWSSPSSTPS